jgi:hypothetical protein
MNLHFKTKILSFNSTGKIKKLRSWLVKSTISMRSKNQSTCILNSLKGRSWRLKTKISDSLTCLTAKFAVKPNSTRRT